MIQEKQQVEMQRMQAMTTAQAEGVQSSVAQTPPPVPGGTHS